MLGEAMDAVARELKWAKTALIGLGVLMLAGNTIATIEFLRVGRGGYLNAVNYMAANTPRQKITVGGDQDFRNGYYIDFYSRYLPKDRSLVYLRHSAWTPEGLDWYIIQNSCHEENFVPKDIVVVGGETYRLVESYPVLGLTGMGCNLYRNDSKF
jgi:hypothetical protein